LGGTILPGVMRDSVIQLLETKGIPVEQRAISIDEIIEAHAKGELKEIFGTGTAASISPVGSLGLSDRVLSINDGRVGEMAAELHKTIADLQYGRIPDQMGWTMEVPVR
jgi:branched-chain amino acid aminotransferase